MLTGKIVQLRATYGFIQAAGARADAFFHKSDLPLIWPLLRVGDIVTYELISDAPIRPRALCVRHATPLSQRERKERAS